MSITIILISLLILGSCETKPTAGQLMMDVTGESFPVEKTGLFGKDHNFWVFKIRNVVRTGKKVNTISLKGSERESTERAFGLTLSDPEGYEWDIIALAVLEKGQRPGQSRKSRNISSYTFGARMDEANTMVTRFINASYTPGDPEFDGTLRGTITKENNEVLYRFESNARLDTYPKPDEGLSVISFYIEDTPVAVLDSRNGFEVTFFEGLQPTERTQMSATISTLFVLMKYGIL